ncbi:type II secretion system F family protein [Dickeya chrysanthemi]|uniref:type II secretion system F family protein n=1 Tax=Dickeya chrysanthemi TaxID=556 RepID=UPI0025A191B2|nr:type II secretion system F family protein [Dickeya chrysanthemi]WJM83652.1 type II secretion system F family protein [Dickeya chrysanthemi]
MFSDPVVWLALLLIALGIRMALKSRAHAQVRRLRDRLAAHVAMAETAAVGAPDSILRNQGKALPPRLEKILQPIAAWGVQLAGSARDRQQLRRLLDLAGIRRTEALGWLMAGKLGGGLLLALLLVGGALPPPDRTGLTGLAAALIGFFAGSLLPEAWLKMRAAGRGEKLARAVPDALDLMVVCAEAGLSIGRVLQVVSKELGLSSPEMADELRYTAAELQILADRNTALQHLAERTRVSEIESMVATLLQAERYGTPLSQALRTIADESRKTLLLTLEEKAGKLPAQLSVPLMALILPPIIAIMASPALLRVVRLLGN